MDCMLGLSRERQARDVPVQALGAEDARADGGGGAEPRRPALRHPGAPRHSPALGPASGARRRRSSPARSPTDCPRRPRTTASRSTPRTIRSSTSSSRARSPRASTARGRCASGTGAPTRSSSGSRARSRSRLHGERVQGRYALFPDRQGREPQGLDDPPDGPARRRRGRADAREDRPDDGAHRRRCRATTSTGPSRSSGTACARSAIPSRAGCACTRATCNDITAALSGARAPQPRAEPRTARCSTGRSSPSTTRAGRASARCSGACTWAREATVRRLAKDTPVTYVIFDLLWLDGHSLMDLPYTERRARLAELELGDGGRWRVPDYVVGHGAQLLAATRAAGPRGRHRQAPGLAPTSPGGARASWLKIKNTSRQEVVVGGWVPGDGRRRDRIGALLVGVREDDGSLRYAGASAPASRRPSSTAWPSCCAPRARGLALRSRRPEDPARSRLRRARAGGRGRVPRVDRRRRSCARPSYKGLRDDKPAELVVREEANADRWPRSAGARSSSPTSTRCCIPRPASPSATSSTTTRASRRPSCRTSGPPADAQALPQRRRRASSSTRSTRPRTARTGCETRAQCGVDRLLLADDVPTLVWLANLADLELHTSLALARRRPSARRSSPSTSTPGRRRRSSSAAASRVLLRGMFEGLGLRVLRQDVGLEGHAGLRAAQHAEATYAQTKAFAKAVAELLEREEPELVVSRQTKPRARARCSSTGARTTTTRRRSTSTRCARVGARPCRRR